MKGQVMRITSLLLLVVGLALVGCDQTTDTMDTTTTPSTGAPDTSGTGGTDTTTPSSTTPSTTTPGSTDTSSTEPVAPDNTARNQRETKTPEDQEINSADEKITLEIRQKITGDETMSLNARNVKIVTEQGKVTLTGVVDNADEKQAIEKFAHDIAGGADKVTSKIEVANR
jgi:hyperosmotically inducible periplasmic protein